MVAQAPLPREALELRREVKRSNADGEGDGTWEEMEFG